MHVVRVMPSLWKQREFIQDPSTSHGPRSINIRVIIKQYINLQQTPKKKLESYTTSVELLEMIIIVYVFQIYEHSEMDDINGNVFGDLLKILINQLFYSLDVFLQN